MAAQEPTFEQSRPMEPPTRRRGLRRPLPEPRVEYLGPAAVWWIPKPRGPRITLRRAGLAWLGLLPLIAATMLWSHLETESLWPFGRRISSLPEILLRYELILMVCLAYLTIPSGRSWLRHRRFARRDARAVEQAIEQERWELAGLLLHRYCLLTSALWGRLPSRVGAWDAVIRGKLPRHRRVYVYHRGKPPGLPGDATAGFAISVIPPPKPSLWSATALLPVALILYVLVVDVARHGHPQRLILFNAVLLAGVLLFYGTYFMTALLGRSNFFRFAPGVLQLVRYRTFRRRPLIRTWDLRRMHLVLDLSSKYPGLTLLDEESGRRSTLRLPRGDEAREAVFRAALSTVPSPPLPEDRLVD